MELLYIPAKKGISPQLRKMARRGS